MLTKIIVIALLTIFLSLLLKSVKSEYAVMINIGGGTIILCILIDSIVEFIGKLTSIASNSYFSSEIILLLLKVLIIGYIVEFTADIAEDSGNKFMSSKILLGGKIAVCIMVYPVVLELLNAINSLLI